MRTRRACHDEDRLSANRASLALAAFDGSGDCLGFRVIPVAGRVVSHLLWSGVIMSPATSVTYDRLRWWIVGVALVTAAVSAVSLSSDVDADAAARADSEASAPAAERR